MTTLEKIDKLRKEQGWSINNLAMEAMLTQSTLNNLYNRQTEPKLSTLTSICNAFGITLAEFFTEEKTDNVQKETEIDKELERKISALSLSQKKSLLQFLKTF